ncbi:MAG: hypothetical protein AMXMBFR66_07320 [Pseudomonadota bacterium]
MFDELVLAVSRGAGLTAEQAALAVAAMLRFFTARMPSALVGELHVRLGRRAGEAPPGAPAAPAPSAPPAPPAPPAGSAP